MLRPVDAVTATTKRGAGSIEVKRWTWDCAYGFMVRAETEEEARSMASAEAGDEGADSWTDSNFSTCEAVSGAEGEPGIVMTDFLAG